MKHSILTLCLLSLGLLLGTQAVYGADETHIDSIRVWISLGNKALEKGNDIEAAEYFSRCADYVEPGENIRVNGSILFSISRIYFDNGDLDEAEKYVVKSIEIAKALELPSIIPPRYALLSEVYLKKGLHEKALDAAKNGKHYAEHANNQYMISHLEILEADALDALGANPKDVRLIYENAVARLKREGNGKVRFKKVYFRLAANSLKQGDTARACEYYRGIMKRQAWIVDDLDIMAGAQALSGLVKDPKEAAYYASIADSLSYARDLMDFTNALAMSSIEFSRRQKDAEIAQQKQRVAAFVLLTALLLVVSILLGAMLISRNRVSRELARRNASLVKVSIQKDRLLAIASANAESSEIKDEIKSLSEDDVPLPKVKLTPREMEIARLVSQGLQNKEIAGQLGISPMTVGVHKNNLYKKLGVGNTIELLRYMQKVGL